MYLMCMCACVDLEVRVCLFVEYIGRKVYAYLGSQGIQYQVVCRIYIYIHTHSLSLSPQINAHTYTHAYICMLTPRRTSLSHDIGRLRALQHFLNTQSRRISLVISLVILGIPKFRSSKISNNSEQPKMTKLEHMTEEKFCNFWNSEVAKLINFQKV